MSAGLAPHQLEAHDQPLPGTALGWQVVSVRNDPSTSWPTTEKSVGGTTHGFSCPPERRQGAVGVHGHGRLELHHVALDQLVDPVERPAVVVRWPAIATLPASPGSGLVW